MKHKENDLLERIIKLVEEKCPTVEYIQMGITHLRLTVRNMYDKEVIVSVGRCPNFMLFGVDKYGVILIIEENFIEIDSSNKLKKKLYNIMTDLRYSQLRNSIKI